MIVPKRKKSAKLISYRAQHSSSFIRLYLIRLRVSLKLDQIPFECMLVLLPRTRENENEVNKIQKIEKN